MIDAASARKQSEVLEDALGREGLGYKDLNMVRETEALDEKEGERDIERQRKRWIEIEMDRDRDGKR